MNDSNPQEPKIVVDDDWKSQVQQEKEKAKEMDIHLHILIFRGIFHRSKNQSFVFSIF